MWENQILSTMKSMMFNGPHAYSIAILFFLWSHTKYLLGFVLAFFLNSGVNKLLKQWIQEPRPRQHNQVNDGGKYTKSDKYGMPSGHSQTIFFAISYSWFVLRNVALAMTGIFMASLTLYQRWHDKKHTTSQLAVGCVMGLFMGWISYKITKKVISNYNAKTFTPMF